jgi:glycosyltransferase involved in cell wall biosynthesis
VVHTWQDATNVAAGLAALAAGVPRVVLSTRSLSPDHFPFLTPYMRPAYRAMLGSRRVAILNNSRAGAASYAEWLGVAADRIEVLHNALAVPGMGGDHATFRRTAGIPADAPVIGSVFRLSEEKQPLLWLDAVLAALTQRRDAHAVLIGDGPMRGEVLARLKDTPAEARFHYFAAWRPAAEAIAAFDLFFLASRVEGLPNVVLEAQTAGVPVVATEVGGMAEAVLPGRTAILVAPQDATAERLRHALLAVLDDHAFRARTRSEAPSFVAHSFAPGAMAEKLLDLYGMPAGVPQVAHSADNN